ncbi:unnamed protein product [Symbiodinium sp. CCMP2456]|nr:unnamed protein product [Symbiodinium sp. CCMP2456]
MLSHKGAFSGERLKDGCFDNLKIAWGQSPTTRQEVDGFVSMPSMSDQKALIAFLDWKGTGRLDVSELATVAAVQLPLHARAMDNFIRENFQVDGDGNITVEELEQKVLPYIGEHFESITNAKEEEKKKAAKLRCDFLLMRLDSAVGGTIVASSTQSKWVQAALDELSQCVAQGDPIAVAVVSRLMTHPEPEVRSKAAQLLPKIVTKGDPQAFESLSAALGNDSSQVRELVVESVPSRLQCMCAWRLLLALLHAAKSAVPRGCFNSGRLVFCRSEGAAEAPAPASQESLAGPEALRSSGQTLVVEIAVKDRHLAERLLSGDWESLEAKRRLQLKGPACLQPFDEAGNRVLQISFPSFGRWANWKISEKHAKDCGDGGMTWAMAVGLAKLLGQRPEYPRLRVLELGAGPGLVALLLAARGHEVVATDGADCVLANLRRNAAEQNRIGVRRLRWHVEDDLRHSLGAFDLLVGADLVHDATQCDALRAVLRAVRGASEVLLMERDRLGQGRRCAELMRGDGLDLELEPASSTSAATGDVIVDGQRNPPHLLSEMASALLIRLALPDLREKGRMANFEDSETLEVLCARLRTASAPVQRAVLEALPHVAAPCSEPALGAVRAALKGLAAQPNTGLMALHPGARTTTWDRPPLGLARTETLLESARVSPAAPEVRPLPENRADSSGWTPSPHPAGTQVPPTTLRELQPIPLTRTVATGPSQLQRLGTWSQAPEAAAAPWPRMMAPQRLGATGLPPAVPAQPLQRASTTTGGHPAVPQPLQRASTTNTGARAPVVLSRACTLTLPRPPALNVPATQARPIVLQRTGTVTLAESTPGLTAQPAQLPAQPLQRAGTVTMPETAEKSASAAPMRVFSPAPVTSIVSQATSASSVRRMPTKEDLPEVGRLLFQSMLGRLEAPEEEPPRQLRLVIGGLMGSGKSTICRMLRHLLQGTWINQDEFSSQKNAKKAFLKAIAEAAADDAVAVLLVDKINTERQHRSGIVQEMRKGRPGDIVYVQIKHPDDATDRWENTLSWCESRIARRGSGHRTLMADNPQLRSILQRTAQAAEPLSKEEARNFAATLRVNMVQTSIVQVMKLLQDLDEVGLLEPRFELASLLQEHRLLQAQDAANRAEWELAAAASKGKGKGQKDESPKGPPPVWYWVVQLDEASSELLLKRWEQQEDYDTAVASGISVAKEHHVTLLYLGGGKDEEVATRNPKLEGPAHVAQLREEFKRRAGEKVDLDVTSIVWEEGRIAAASVALRGGIDQLCANVHPHITLGTAARVNAVKSNEVLARRAATLDLQSGLQAWLQQLSLAQYTERLGAWCLQMGAASPEELAEFASDAAAAIETDDPEAQGRVAEVLKSAVERPLQELRLANPLQLTGVIHGVSLKRH